MGHPPPFSLSLLMMMSLLLQGQIVTAVELQSSKTGAILMEYCSRGHLLEALNSLGGKRMPEAAVLSVMCDVVW